MFHWYPIREEETLRSFEIPIFDSGSFKFVLILNYGLFEPFSLFIISKQRLNMPNLSDRYKTFRYLEDLMTAEALAEAIFDSSDDDNSDDDVDMMADLSDYELDVD